MTSASGKVFTINYTGNPNQNGIHQHSVFLILVGDKTVSSHDDGTSITVVMDYKQYAIPSTLGWRNGGNIWPSFTMDIRKAQQFDVYANDQKVGLFSPDVRNAQKVLPTLANCIND